MALSFERRRELLAMHLPEDASVREELNDYLARTGLHYADFAHRINYSKISVSMFLSGRYESIAANSKNLRASIRAFIDANPVGTRENGAAAEKLYRTENVKLLEKYFNLALSKPLAYFVYGPPGTQKSHILKKLIADLVVRELPKNGTGKCAFYIYCRAGIHPTDLLKRVAEATGIP